jgi:HicA toxin of bacterial toxin-antitoxin,
MKVSEVLARLKEDGWYLVTTEGSHRQFKHPLDDAGGTRSSKQSHCHLGRGDHSQAELARTQGNQEAATKRLSRLIRNERLSPKALAEWLCRRALDHGVDERRRSASAGSFAGRWALPIFWRASDQAVLKGRMKCYERAVLKRAVKLNGGRTPCL